MPDEFPYDVFLSHSAKDKPVVRDVAERLRKDGLWVWFDEWEILPGDSIPAKIEEGLERSRVLVLCMSANAFGSDWAQLESGTFRFRDPLNKERRFLPLRLDDAPIKGSLAQFLYVDFRFSRDAALQDLLAAICSEVRSSVLRRPDWISMPERQWKGSPGALLRADLAVVPFHGREQELATLREWALGHDVSTARLITGPGGMGKTRLARELCLQLGEQGIPAGFFDLSEKEQCLAELKAGTLDRALIVVDYAETLAEDLAAIFRLITKRNLAGIRVLLLARGAGFWWQKLKRQGDGVGDCLQCEPVKLATLALDVAGRRASFQLAASAFAKRLGESKVAVEPEDIGAAYYERTLLLHMSALLAIGGVQAQGMDPIMELVLGREADYFARQVKGTPLAHLERGFERAMGLISAFGGVRDKDEAVEVLSQIGYFRDESRAVIEAVADHLHNCYPGSKWIEPIQPDLLMEYLIAKATREDFSMLQDLVLPV